MWERRLSQIGWSVLAGFGGGLFLATGFSLFVLIMHIFAGRAQLARYHTTLGTVIGIYYGGFCAGGVAAGLVAPLRHSWWGRMILGFVVAFPVYLGFGLAVVGPHFDFSVTTNLVIAAAVAAVIGGGLGLDDRIHRNR